MNDKTAAFVSASQDQTAMIWEWNIEQNAVECMFVCKGHERGIDSVDVSPSGKLFATGSWDTLLKVWSAGKTNKLFDWVGCIVKKKLNFFLASDLQNTQDESSSKKARTAQAQTRVLA